MICQGGCFICGSVVCNGLSTDFGAVCNTSCVLTLGLWAIVKVGQNKKGWGGVYPSQISLLKFVLKFIFVLLRFVLFSFK